MTVPASIAICVPARNEAVLLPRLLDALARQDCVDAFILCVLLDSCTDFSETLLRQRAASLPFPLIIDTFVSLEPNAGRARRRAMDLGLAYLPADGGLIISTDADTIPDAGWLVANKHALAQADIVTGLVRRVDGQPCAIQDRIEAYYDSLYALRRVVDPVSWDAAHTHHYTSAASMSFQVSAYRVLGGFQPLAFGEDGALIDDAYRAGLRVRRDAAVQVCTSARREGRAIVGLASHLRSLDAGSSEPRMAHPEDALWRYHRQAAARRAWDNIDAARMTLALLLQCEPDHIDRIAIDATNAEAFATRVVPEPPGGDRIVPLSVAEVALRRLFVSSEAAAA